jgi:hypothetical protein
MATITYTDGAGTGLWENDLNWSHPTGVLPRVPGAGDDVIIPASMSVEMDGSLGLDEMNSIQIGAGALLEVDNQDAINKSSPAEIDDGGTNLGTITIGLQSSLSIGGDFDNAGVINVGGGATTDNNTADYLNLSSSPITGGGTIVLRNGWVQGALTNTDNTVSGYGYMGNNDADGGALKFALDNKATIDANGEDINGFVQSLVIQAGATVAINTGLLEATNPNNAAVTGGLSLYEDTINNIGGVIEATGANTHVDLTGTTVEGGTLETRLGGEITFDASSLLDGRGSHLVTVDGALEVNDHASLNLAGTIDLVGADGTDILLNSTSAAADLVIAATGVSLTGGGKVTLGGTIDDKIIGAAAGAILLVTTATLDGGGDIGGNLTVVNRVGGVIDANSTKDALTIDTGSNVLTNTGLLEATGGGNLIISDTTVNGSTGGTIEAGTGSIVTLEGSSVIGGVLTTVGTGSIQETTTNTFDARTSAIQNKGLFEILDGGDVTIEGSIVNTGVIAMGDNEDGNAILRIGAATSLSGGGTLRLNQGTDGRIILGVAASDTLTNVDNTIEGAGTLGDGQLTLVNQAKGVINSNGPGLLMIVTGSLGSLTNDGLIEATGKGGLTIDSTTMNDSGGGIIQAGYGALVTLSNDSLVGGILKTLGTGAIHAIDTSTLDARTSAIQNQGQFVVVDGGDVTIEGAIVNTGSIGVGDNGSGDAFLRIGAATTLSGGGTLRLNQGSDGKFVIGVAATDTLTNVDNMIVGAGTLGDGQLTLVNEAKGVIDANGPGVLVLDTGGSGSVTNDGLIEAAGKGGLTISSSTVDNFGGGIVLAANGSLVSFSGADVIGGLVESVGAGAVQLTGQSTLDGRAHAVTLKGSLNVLNNETLLVEGAIDNAGKISIEDAGSFTALRLAANVALSGGGDVVLSDSSSNYVIGTALTTLTNVNNTISGAGQLSDSQLRLVNQSAGVIDANGVNALVIESDGGQSATNDDVNSGLMEATGAGGLTISLTTFDQSGGGTILAGAGSAVTLSLSEVIGGTLKTTGTGAIDVQGLNVFDGRTSTVNNTGLINILDGANFEALSKLNNTGTITLKGVSHPAIFASINAVLSGGGALQLSNSRENIIEGATSTESLTNVDNTISGAGLIGNGQMILTNEKAGVIDGTLSAGLVIDTGSNTIVNSGLIGASAGGSITINSAVTNYGVIEANGGVLTLNATVTYGKVLINGGTLDFTQAGAVNSVTFAGATGVLRLDQSATFHGSVSGLSQTGGSSLDLSDIGFVSAGEASFVENAAKTGGLLTVTDGAHTAKISLLGDYSDLLFTAKSDGHGGTTVTAAAAPGPHALVQAMASFGVEPAGVTAAAPASDLARQPLLVSARAA